MSANQATVCVITPCYNGAAFIGECIESVLKQTYTHFEYLLVNKLQHGPYAANHARLRQSRSPNQGP